jgi:hypothetical protein
MKVSILLQYGRIFTVRSMRIPLHIVMAICVLWGITTVFTSIFTCVPVYAYWDVLEQSTAKCLDSKTYVETQLFSHTADVQYTTSFANLFIVSGT